MGAAFKSGLIALLAMFAVPIGSLLVALDQKGRLDDKFMNILAKNDAQRIQELRRSGLSFETFCAADKTNQYADICSLIDNVHIFEWSAMATIALGIAAMALAVFVPLLVGRSRKWLAILFSPTVRIVTFAVGVSFCIQAPLAGYVLYILETQAVGRFHVQIIGAIAIGGFIAGVLVLKATFSIFRHQPLYIVGQRLRSEQEPAFFARLGELAGKTSAGIPANVVVGLEPNFFVTSAPVLLAGDKEPLSGNTLYLSAPLCRLLTVSEFDAVLCHEFGHFSGEDTLYSMRFAPAYRTLGDALRSVALHARRGGLMSAMAMPAMSMLEFCLFQFAKTERRISREREYLADRAGASVGGASALATALLKVGIYAPLWGPIVGRAVDVLNDGKAYQNLSEFFGGAANDYGGKETGEKIREVANSATAHPTDTHPTTKDRIAALGLDAETITPEQVLPASANQASFLLASLTRLEEALTLTYQQWLVAIGRASPPARPQETQAPAA